MTRKMIQTKTSLGAVLLLCLCNHSLQGQSDYPSPEALLMRQRPQKAVVEIGARETSGDTGVAKFSEYRDLGSGAFIRNLSVLSELPMSGYYVRLQSRENSENDLQSLVTAGAYGRLKVTVSWNRLFHAVSTSGRDFYVRTGPGKFLLPSGFQSLQGAPRENLSLKRDSVGLGLGLTPSEALDFRLQYSPEKRSGSRPAGNNFAFTVFELPEPIEYRTDDLKLSAEVSKSRWTIQGSSQTSLFHNDVQALEWTSSFPTNDPLVPGAGRKALPPDNSAQNFMLSGALDLARSARIVATVSPGWMRQNEAFLPFTINSALQAQPNYPALPASSLNGNKQTLMMNYLVTGRVKKQFSYSARYRSYRLDNETPSLLFSNYVSYDASLPVSTQASPRNRRNLPYGYTRQNAHFDWIWAPSKTASAKWFYQWESWDRTYREVRRSNEHTVGASWDWMNKGGWGVQALMQHSLRRPEQYDPTYFDASYPAGTGIFALGPLPGLRRFDVAERSRNYGTLSLQTPPIKSFQFSASYIVDRSFFNESSYGSLYDLSDGISCDVSYPLRSSISLFADYTFERLRYALRARQRLDGSPGVVFNDSPINNWESNIRDFLHTWGAGVNTGFFRNRIVMDVYYGFSQGRNSTATTALGDPTAAGFLVSSAEDYPKLSNRFQRLTASLKFPVTNSTSYRVEYIYERYGERDLALDQVVPFSGLTNVGATNAGFLGTTLPRYHVNILSFSLVYVF